MAKELKYYERLDIPVLTIQEAKQLIKNDIMETLEAWKKSRQVEKQCFHIIGPAGVGKTQICYQIAEELSNEERKFDIILVKAPVLSRDDFIIPFPVKNGNGAFSFKMLYSDFVPTDKNSYGLFVIDEFSRGDHRLQQLLWQVQNEYSIHRYEFPKGWFVITTDNPDESEYNIDYLEDAAGLRRQLHVYIRVSAEDFLRYAIEKKFHPLVIEFIQTHPEYVYDFNAQKNGAVFANPASYEKLSDHLWKMELTYGKLDFDVIEEKAGGLLNTHMTQLFIEFARDKKDINPKDIVYNFESVEGKVKQLIEEGNMSKLSELMTSFCTYLTTSMPPLDDKVLKNIEMFITMLPVDTAALFVSQLDSLPRSSKEFRYITNIHINLTKNSEKYRVEFYEPLIKLK